MFDVVYIRVISEPVVVVRAVTEPVCVIYGDANLFLISFESRQNRNPQLVVEFIVDCYWFATLTAPSNIADKLHVVYTFSRHNLVSY